jgi:hypothetical protein
VAHATRRAGSSPPTPMSAAWGYVPHLLYSLSIVSISTHLLWHRKEWDSQRAHVAAQISVLKSITGRLRSGERMDAREIDRLQRMVRGKEDKDASSASDASYSTEETRWREVLLGKAGIGQNHDAYDKKDWEARACYVLNKWSLTLMQ